MYVRAYASHLFPAMLALRDYIVLCIFHFSLASLLVRFNPPPLSPSAIVPHADLPLFHFRAHGPRRTFIPLLLPFASSVASCIHRVLSARTYMFSLLLSIVIPINQNERAPTLNASTCIHAECSSEKFSLSTAPIRRECASVCV